MHRNNRPKKYSLNNYNLSSDGQLMRGSLETNDGIHVPLTVKPNGNLGWIPSQVKKQLLGRNVRFALDWRANPDFRPGIPMLVEGLYFREYVARNPIPFGWVARRHETQNLWRIAPLWFFVPEYFAIARSWVYHFCKYRLGCLAGEQGALWSEHRWWPSMPRFSDYDLENAARGA